MSTDLREIEGERCFTADADGPIVRDAEGGRSLIEEAMNAQATVIVVPVRRLDASFFQLRSGLAGGVLQKAMNYNFKVAVIGDIEDYVAASTALRDFVIECNRGRDIFFLPDVAALAGQLAKFRAPQT